MKNITISGIACEMEPDENGFIDIFIHHWAGGVFGLPEGYPYHEWLVRGALDEKAAIELAARLIAEKRKGRIIIHGVEGSVSVADVTKFCDEDGEDWKMS